ncbi:MAG TPA: Gfo/Idh/MocA family oxidoreductase [Thermomicrobiales bacterium]|nr:Gfo/Idh/MocA family oxidoreductase [Thermomicrobiales bacterium]
MNRTSGQHASAAVRFAVIGAGGMGRTHVANIAASPDAGVRWVVDLDEALCTAAAKLCGARASTEMDEALGDPEVDAVLIALPTSAHRMATERAAEAGKHVFCEKPIARHVEDAVAMTEACERADVIFQVGHVVRFFPEYARIKQVLDAGTLGQIAMVRTQRRSAPVMERSPWFADLEKNGGIIIDLMIHDLDTLRWYFGDVERVFAHGLSYTEWQQSRDVAMASLRFRNGVIAHLDASWAHGGFYTAIEVAGEKGLLSHNSRKNATLTFESSEGTADKGNIAPQLTFTRPSTFNPYSREVAHFVEAIRTGSPVMTHGAEATRTLALAQSVLDSMRTGRPVVIESNAVATTTA